jgi:hypothetical protein
MPIVHEKHFWQNLPYQHPSLILSMCAIGSLCGQSPDGSFWPHQKLQSSLNSANPLQSSSIAQAEHLFSSSLKTLDFERPSVGMCQALLVLAFYTSILTSTHRDKQGGILGGVAVRMVPLLKLDKDPDDIERMEEENKNAGRLRAGFKKKWTWLDKEIRRRLFYGMLVRLRKRKHFLFQQC